MLEKIEHFPTEASNSNVSRHSDAYYDLFNKDFVANFGLNYIFKSASDRNFML